VTLSVTACDLCKRIPGHSLPKGVEMTEYNCGHAICASHPLEKTERGEPLCPKCRGPVYIKRIFS
jgi:hypothetical protein